MVFSMTNRSITWPMRLRNAIDGVQALAPTREAQAGAAAQAGWVGKITAAAAAAVPRARQNTVLGCGYYLAILADHLPARRVPVLRDRQRFARF